jgi:DNA mismatch repair protein MutS
MGGKSTVMRQTALIVILGQMGAPVPAAAARWGAVSRLYTRIGAHDAIARGQSTFMVEMTELAHILHHADERSLIVLDEIGRGTSTYDGISVAWSSLEWICRQIRCRTLFATHYHELTRLAMELPLAANAHMGTSTERASQPRDGTRGAGKGGASASRAGGLRFLYKLMEGPAQESFGVHVARIAGLPKPVIDRAWSVLEELERHAPHSGATASVDQLSLFAAVAPRATDVGDEAGDDAAVGADARPAVGPAEPTPAEPVSAEPAPPHPVLVALESTDINQMTPVQALNFVVKLQQELAQPSA